jgi:predicted exporter
VIDHDRLDPQAPHREVVRRLRPSLTLGALTTMASFAGLVLTAFPGFREIGFFAIVGVGSALCTTLFVLPGFLGGSVSSGGALPLARRVARGLGDGVRALARRRRMLASVPLLCIAGTALFLPQLHFVDDLSSLMAIDPALRAEEVRVRERVERVEDARVVVALGRDAESAVARNDQVAARLAAARGQGVLSGFRSLHAFLWSRELQDRNLQVLDSIPDLADRVEVAFAAEGFRPAALAPFRASLAAPPPPPLDVAELRASPLEDVISPFLLDLGDRTAAVTYLRGVTSPAELEKALQGLAHIHVFDQKSFLNEVYRQFRVTTLEQVGVGSILVVLVLGLRYRRWRPALAALLPSLLAAGVLLALFSAFDVELNLLHVTSLTLVMGMGVDYGIFMVDSVHDRQGFDATMLSLLLCCLTTVFVFGTLAISSQPALRAIGSTTGLGILLSFVLAPVTLVVLRGTAEEPES